VVGALEKEEFFILPHPEILEYFKERAITMNGGSLTCAKSRRSISVKRIRRTINSNTWEFTEKGKGLWVAGSITLFMKKDCPI